MYQVGMSAVLGGPGAATPMGDCVWNGAAVKVDALVLTSALVGSLTIVGIGQANGQPQSWVIPPGSIAGIYNAPGTAQTGGAALWASFSNAVDLGKAVIAFH